MKKTIDKKRLVKEIKRRITDERASVRECKRDSKDPTLTNLGVVQAIAAAHAHEQAANALEYLLVEVQSWT